MARHFRDNIVRRRVEEVGERKRGRIDIGWAKKYCDADVKDLYIYQLFQRLCSRCWDHEASHRPQISTVKQRFIHGIALHKSHSAFESEDRPPQCDIGNPFFPLQHASVHIVTSQQWEH